MRPLPTGEWVSSAWSKEGPFSSALVLWNFDVGSWDFRRVCAWMASIEVLMQEKFGMKACFVGAMNEKCCGRKHWQRVTGCVVFEDSESLANLWNSKPTKLAVLPQQPKGGVSKFLFQEGMNAIRARDKRFPGALVFPAAFAAMEVNSQAMFEEARRQKVKTIVLHWSTGGRTTVVPADHTFFVGKDTGHPVCFPPLKIESLRDGKQNGVVQVKKEPEDFQSAEERERAGKKRSFPDEVPEKEEPLDAPSTAAASPRGAVQEGAAEGSGNAASESNMAEGVIKVKEEPAD
uniref:Uncharacterized protein n=1 Tax=Chromera velia CCMP2878 TaxID=1169474 RepID=A0A0G4F8S6_9ALVE|eukprot:Cvel_2942.t1-p1 / transcript=Cvel_2942.t1 / gene=Cvel_2942 / organism=Chromera_velia_CCMP2878 / gene_product=hypothetical protein / transcript_product=hypothetical protein / location=Cvel_scaffold116:61465-62331(-) / protein_length=289 / sequence_SO=supercontig / SO=protein_coding / is_pseudo=false